MIYKGSFAGRGRTYDVTINSGGTTVKTVSFGKNPLVIKWDGDGDVFKPVKYASGTLNLLTKELPADLFSSTRNGVSVAVSSQGSTVFSGFVSPGTFEQPFPDTVVDLELQVYDALSSLEYVPYQTDLKDILSFRSTIDKIFSTAGISFSGFYAHAFSNKTLNDLYISEQNWFDEDGEAMSCKEVLEDLMKWCGLTMFCVGTSVYCIDYNLLKKGVTTGLQNCRLLHLQDYDVAAGVNISMSDVYKKISIRSSLYSFNDLIPSITSDDNVYESGSIFSGVADTTHYEGRTVTNKYIAINPSLPAYNPISLKSKAAAFVRGAAWHKDDEAKKRKDWNTYLAFRNNKSLDVTLIATASRDCAGAFSGYMSISCDYYIQDYDAPLPRDNAKEREMRFDHIGISVSIGNRWLKLTRVSDEEYTAEWVASEVINPIGEKDMAAMGCAARQNTWLSLPSTTNHANEVPDLTGLVFKLPDDELLTGGVQAKIYAIGSKGGESFAQWYFFKDIKLNCSYPVDTSQDGFVSISEAKESDTLYTATIDDSNVSKLNDIEMKVATNTAKGLSFSAVMIRTNGKFQFLGTLQNKALNQTEIQEDNLLDSYLSQYGEPALHTSLSIKEICTPLDRFTDANYAGMLHIVDSAEIDYAAGWTNLNLIEKK